MSKYLITTSETYRVDSEEEVNILLEEAKTSNKYDLSKYNCQYKEKKIKGEVLDSWYKVTLVKNFNDEKEPSSTIEISYGLEF
jgi:hypothetical protein